MIASKKFKNGNSNKNNKKKLEKLINTKNLLSLFVGTLRIIIDSDNFQDFMALKLL